MLVGINLIFLRKFILGVSKNIYFFALSNVSGCATYYFLSVEVCQLTIIAILLFIARGEVCDIVAVVEINHAAQFQQNPFGCIR